MNVLRLFTKSISPADAASSHIGGYGGENAEQRLVRAAQQGDRRAFDALSEIYAPMLRNFLLYRVGQDAVDDLLQETLLAGWTGLPGYHRRAKFKSWLFAIAVRKVVDFYRASGRASNLKVVPLIEAENHVGLQKDWYAVTDWKQSIEVALQKLSVEQREVIEMYYYAELTLLEISQTLGRNLNTVKYQFYRAHTLIGSSLNGASEKDLETR